MSKLSLQEENVEDSEQSLEEDDYNLFVCYLLCYLIV